MLIVRDRLDQALLGGALMGGLRAAGRREYRRRLGGAKVDDRAVHRGRGGSKRPAGSRIKTHRIGTGSIPPWYQTAVAVATINRAQRAAVPPDRQCLPDGLRIAQAGLQRRLALGLSDAGGPSFRLVAGVRDRTRRRPGAGA